MASEKKGFLQSGAFKLVLAWLALGVVLNIAAVAAQKPMLDACTAWMEEYKAQHPGEAAEHHGAASEENINACLLAEEEGSTHPNLVASFYALTGKLLAGNAWAIPNFLILITLLVYFTRDMVQSNMKSRREELERSIVGTEKLRREAEALRADYERKIAEMGAELERLRAEMRSQGEDEKVRILKQAQAMAERIRVEADFTAKQETLVAQFKLREEAAKLAVEIAEQVIREVITDKDRDRLLSDYLETVKESAK